MGADTPQGSGGRGGDVPTPADHCREAGTLADNGGAGSGPPELCREADDFPMAGLFLGLFAFVFVLIVFTARWGDQ